MSRGDERSLVRDSGISHVSAELSRRGWALTRTREKGVGTLIRASKGSKTVNIRVRTSSHGRVGWILNKRDEDIVSDDLYYVFVALKEENVRPDFYVVPSKFVADYIRDTHRYWTTRPPKKKLKKYESMSREEIKKIRMECEMRRFPNDIGKDLPQHKNYDINTHRERWDLLDP